MSGQQLREVDCADDSATNDVAVVIVLFFVHVGGEEHAEGDPGDPDASGSHIVIWRPGLGTVGSSKYQIGDEGFSERKLCAPAPTAAMPAGVITLLGAPLWAPSPRQRSG